MLLTSRLRSPMARSNADNASNTITVPGSASLANIDAGTVLVWFYLTTTASAARTAFGKTLPNGGFHAFKRGVDGTVLRFERLRPTTSCTLDTPTGTLVAGTWQFFGITWDINSSANCRMMVGSLSTGARDISPTVAVGSGAPADDSAQSLAIMSDVTPGGGWPGSVSALAVIRRVLSPRDIAGAQFDDWRQFGCAGLWYPGREGGSGVVVDYSGNGNHGVNTGTLAMEAAPVPIVRPVLRRYWIAGILTPKTYVPVSANSNSGWNPSTDATRVAALTAVDASEASATTDGAIMSMRLG